MRSGMFTRYGGAMIMVLASGCGAHDEHEETAPATGEPMTATVSSFGAGVDELETLVAAHGASIGAAADLAAAQALETTYEADAMAAHSDLHGLVEHMTMCTMDGAAPDTDASALALEAYEMELTAHHEAMDAAADSAAAAAEEERHQAAAADIVAKLRAQHGALSDMADMYMCSDMGGDAHAH